MPNLIRYIEQGKTKPALAARHPLDQFYGAQAAFIAKVHADATVVTS